MGFEIREQMGSSSEGLLFVCVCYQFIIPPGLMTLVLEGAGRLQHVGEGLHGGLRVDHLHILNKGVSFV